METGDQQSCDQVVLRGSAPKQVVTAMAREVEHPSDVETCEWRVETSSQKTAAVANATAAQNDTRLNFTDKYVQKPIMHLTGQLNLRYRGKSFAEHCHYRTIDWHKKTIATVHRGLLLN